MKQITTSKIEFDLQLKAATYHATQCFNLETLRDLVLFVNTPPASRNLLCMKSVYAANRNSGFQS